MRFSSALAAAACASTVALAFADPPPPWRELGPGLRWIETRESFPDERGALRPHVWVVGRLDLRRANLQVHRAENTRVGDGLFDPRALLAFNAGFFEPDHRASGVLRSGGRAWGEAGPAGGSGLLVVHQGVGRLEPRDRLDGGVPYAPEDLVVQCGPRLVEPGGQVGVYRDDGRRFARTALCLRDQGRTLDVILTWEEGAPLRGPGLLHLAHRLGRADLTAARGCEAALNLDGGPSTGVTARAGRGRWSFVHEALGPTPWLLVARP